MMKWSVGRKIGAGFGLALAVLAAFGAMAYQAGSLMIDAGRLEAHTLEVLNELQDTAFHMFAAESGQRGYLLTGDDSYLSSFRQAQPAVAKNISDLRSLTADNRRHQRHLDELEPLITERFKSMRERLKSRGSPQLPALIARGHLNMEKLQRVIREMVVEETAILGSRRERAREGADRMRASILWGTAVAFVFLGAAAFLIVRGITRPIRQTVEILRSASTQLSSTAEEHQRSLVRQSTSVEETASTTAELSASQGQVVGSASSVAALGDKAAEAVEAGRSTIADTLGGLEDMQSKTESASQHIALLSEKSRHVGRIISAITDITEQINLLALNAAIEAARAGDQGKGFAVVAGEVRKLAEKARKSTDEITGLIEDIQGATGATVLATEATLKSVQDGHRRAGKAAKTFEELARLVAETALAVKQIRLACQQQDSATDQISKAMEQISEGMRQTSDSVQQTVSSAVQLTTMADRLRSLIG